MGVEQAYLDLLDSNLELRKKLVKEETLGFSKDAQISKLKIKIYDLASDIRQCERYITYLEKEVVSRDDEIERLKSDCQSVSQQLKVCQWHLDLKEQALVAQDEHIQKLEEMVNGLKRRVHDLSPTSSPQLCNSDAFFGEIKKAEHQRNMAVPDILANIGRALDRVERYINGDTSFDPRNTLNGIRISITTIRGHMQRHVQDSINSQALLNTALARSNDLMTDLANTRAELLQRERMMTQAWRDERRARQDADAESEELRLIVYANIQEKCRWQRRYTTCAQQVHYLREYY